jgi:hypothetical protein
MIATLLFLAALALAGTTATVVGLVRDGYRRMPTRFA